jgi:hypothetical protein
MADRRSQPRCDHCNHPRSFHGTAKCRALGCICMAWAGLPAGAPDWLPQALTGAEVAKRLGRSERWVQSHASDVGGVKVPCSWVTAGQGGQTWVFDPDFDYDEMAVPA